MSATQPAATLLYVEDEFLIRECVAAALRDAGFRVDFAETGAEAIGILEATNERFLGLVTDVNLGDGPDGWAVARRARELDAEIGVVYSSGASNQHWSFCGVPHSIMLAKPFAPAEIVNAMKKLLNELRPV